ncbi:threonylcarbamoyl-AMP synthase [Candidatus Peregrinibacteria bacterium]|nr:threonylcarbamoyl-AMP synthase [Candidatus Peregrinibacteria bacterium]
MKRFKVKGNIWSIEAETEFLKVIQAGGIVMHPTETCYGLAVDVFNEEALAKLHMLKKMAFNKPVSVIVHSIEDAKRWGEINSEAEGLMNQFWPGPYTFIVNRSKNLPPFFNKGIERVGFRNPPIASLLNIVKKIGHPITTTSANISGKPHVYEVDPFISQLREERSQIEPDLILDGGLLEQNEPSAVYDVVDGKVLRGNIDI